MNSHHSNDQRGSRGERRRPRQQRAHVSAARLVAYDVLRDVDERGAYANLALPARIRESRLDGRDAALATELAAGALRWRGSYDRIIELASGREIDRVDPRTRNVLRLGVHQLVGMRTASHAAVHESVELQRKVAGQAATGFVNGVLRAVTRTAAEDWTERIIAEASSPDEALAASTSHPAWIVRALRDALAAEGRAAELTELLEADNVSPRVNLAVLPGAGVTPSEAAAEVAELEDTGPSPFGLVSRGGDPGQLMAALGAPRGLVRVQDQGSQLAALALAAAQPIHPGEEWLDLCAGPGGKTALLGAIAARHGARVRANEVSEHRADLVRSSIAGVRDHVDVVCFDGRTDEAFGGAEARFDRILVDAPCSGLGALRRRPEARWRKTPADLPELTTLQTQLLESAVSHLAPGGVIAYVTCSPHLAETRVIVDRLLRAHPELIELDSRAVLNAESQEDLQLPGGSGSVQLWPHRNGTDAMFISLIGYRDADAVVSA